MADAPITYEQALAKYPDWAWAFNIPDVGNELKKGIEDPSYDPIPKIKQTEWFRHTQASQREWQALKVNDPASAEAHQRETEAAIWDMRQSLGINPDADWVRDTAQKALSLGWGVSQGSNGQLNDYIVSLLKYNPTVGQTAGSLSQTMAGLKSSASDYMVTLSDETAFDYAKSILAGEHDAKDWTSIWQQQAKNQFSYAPEIQKAIDGGVTVKQFTDPIKERIASTLDMNPNDVDLSSPQWASTLDYTDSKGQRRMMTYSEIDQLARSQPQFRYTSKAQQAAASLGETILQKFGKVAA